MRHDDLEWSPPSRWPQQSGTSTSGGSGHAERLVRVEVEVGHHREVLAAHRERHRQAQEALHHLSERVSSVGAAVMNNQERLGGLAAIEPRLTQVEQAIRDKAAAAEARAADEERARTARKEAMALVQWIAGLLLAAAVGWKIVAGGEIKGLDALKLVFSALGLGR